MGELRLLNRDIQELKYVKNIQKPTENLRITTDFEFNGKFNENEKKCFGEVSVVMQDEAGNGEFCFSLRLVGVFEYEIESLTDNDKRNIHLQMYNQLFPLWTSIVNGIFLIIGIPPINFPPLNVSKDSIEVREV